MATATVPVEIVGREYHATIRYSYSISRRGVETCVDIDPREIVEFVRPGNIGYPEGHPMRRHFNPDCPDWLAKEILEDDEVIERLRSHAIDYDVGARDAAAEARYEAMREEW